jgi:catechol 2,3-dioxygenase-like lactoylglutathione lyase family enzyme
LFHIKEGGLAMAEISGIHHACITVSDMERSKKWYQEVLGFKLVTEFYLDVPELGTGVGIPDAQLKGAMLQHGEGENVSMVELALRQPSGKTVGF